MNLSGKTVLITGANRGIGAGLVHAFLQHDVRKIYAGARSLASLPSFNDDRVTGVQIDVTSESSVAAAVAAVESLDVLVNNAGIMTFANVLTATRQQLAADLDVNYFGTLAVTQAFLPRLEQSAQAAIVNISSIVALAPPASISGYSASKAALFSATQATRALLARRNIRVVGVYPGPIDTELAKDLPLGKAPVAATAQAIVDGLSAGQEDIFPDPTSNQLGALWSGNPKELERFFARMQ